jgi:hypothetical protein
MSLMGRWRDGQWLGTVGQGRAGAFYRNLSIDACYSEALGARPMDGNPE